MLWDIVQLTFAIVGFWIVASLANSGLESLYWWYQDKKSEKNTGSRD